MQRTGKKMTRAERLKLAAFHDMQTERAAANEKAMKAGKPTQPTVTREEEREHQAWIDACAKAHGLPDGTWYGVDEASGEFIAPGHAEGVTPWAPPAPDET